MSAPNVVGLDLSVSRTGIAWADGTTSSTKIPAKVKGGSRLYKLIYAEGLRDAIRYGVVDLGEPPPIGRPDLLVLEDYSPGSVGIGGKLTNAELHGCVLLFAAEYGVPVAKVRPSALKRFATGNGSADKDEMTYAAYEQGADVENHDEADAWHLRSMGLAHLTGDATSERLAVADGVLWPDVAAWS